MNNLDAKILILFGTNNMKFYKRQNYMEIKFHTLMQHCIYMAVNISQNLSYHRLKISEFYCINYTSIEV